jgi:adenylate cyclase
MKLVGGEKYGEEFLPPSGSVEVFMKLLKVYEYFYRFNKEDNILARHEAKQAIVLDPEYSKLYSTLAFTHIMDLVYQSSESPLVSFAQASKNIRKALALDDGDWFAHVALSLLNLYRKEHDKAIAGAERAIALNPNGATAYKQLGSVLVMSGRAEEGIKLIEKAIRLNPIPPAHYLQDLGYGYYKLGRYEDAIEVCEEALKLSPNSLFAHLGLIASYSASGREEKARRQAQELMRLDPTFSVEQFAEIFPIKDKAEVERLIHDLRKAGLK